MNYPPDDNVNQIEESYCCSHSCSSSPMYEIFSPSSHELHQHPHLHYKCSKNPKRQRVEGDEHFQQTMTGEFRAGHGRQRSRTGGEDQAEATTGGSVVCRLSWICFKRCGKREYEPEKNDTDTCGIKQNCETYSKLKLSNR